MSAIVPCRISGDRWDGVLNHEWHIEHPTASQYEDTLRYLGHHGIRVLVVGLDFQSDITRAFGLYDWIEDDDQELVEGENKLIEIKSLLAIYEGKCTAHEAVLHTDIPYVDFIPETFELGRLDRGLASAHVGLGNDAWQRPARAINRVAEGRVMEVKSSEHG